MYFKITIYNNNQHQLGHLQGAIRAQASVTPQLDV